MKQNTSSLITLISVFFFWGFLAASNGIFIPFCKTHFQLSQFQSQLIDSAFYGAYFIGSLLLYIISLSRKRDIINQLGYKKTIIYGLIISIGGSLLMLPAVGSGSFTFILSAFFVIALGFSLQQSSANPLVLNLGNPATGSYRLNFAGSVNSLGTTIGPILVSLILFGKVVASDTDKTGASIGSISILYIILAGALGLAVLILAIARIPKLSIEQDEGTLKILREPLYLVIGIVLLLVILFGWSSYTAMNGAEGGGDSKFYFLAGVSLALIILLSILLLLSRRVKKENQFESTRYPQVIWGMIAIFVYVGVEVTIQSNMGTLLKLPEFGGYNDATIGPFISVYWGSLMIGRWTGAIGAFDLKKPVRILLTLLIPFVALSLVLFMNHLSGASIREFILYPICVAVLVGAFFLASQRPAFTLLLFGLLGVAAMLTGLLTSGTVSIYAFLSGGLFCSIMWPSIFSLAIAGLGKYTSQASNFLIMMILGGGLIPPIQGLIADVTDIHSSYIVTVACFAYLAFYAWRVKGILRRQGIDYDKTTTTT